MRGSVSVNSVVELYLFGQIIDRPMPIIRKTSVVNTTRTRLRRMAPSRACTASRGSGAFPESGAMVRVRSCC